MTVNDTRIAEVKEALSSGRALIVLGAGVSAAASDNPTAGSWVKLLASGREYAIDHRGDLPKNFEKIVDAQLEDPQYTAGLVSAAELITNALGGSGSADFRQWIRQAVGEAEPNRPRLIEAILRLRAPIATLNYDTLVEQVSAGRRVARTWKSPHDMQAAMTTLTNDVAHLHGVWSEPESVVFGAVSYGRLLENEASQALERAITALRSLIFIGCGDTFGDPNFDGLLGWLDRTFPSSNVRHYILCRAGQVAELASKIWLLLPVSYGETYDELPGFLETLASNLETKPPARTAEKTIAELLEKLRAECIFADQISDLDARNVRELIVPPVLLPVTYEQFALAQRDQDGPKVERVNGADDLRDHRCIVVVGGESSGLTTALQWLSLEASRLGNECAPLLVDFRSFVGARPLDRSVRIALRLASASIDNKSELPPLALALDNVVPGDRGSFPKLLAELPMSSASWLILGCRPGSEPLLVQSLKSVGLQPVTRYLGRLNTGDIESLASLVAPQQAERLASKAVSIIQREHLARTPLTVGLLLSVLIAGEAFLSTASETALLDAYVNLLLGRGSAYDDARFVLDAHDNSSLLSELARKFVDLNASAVDESVAIAAFEGYFQRVGWTESAAEALATLIRRHVLIRRHGKISFSQLSLLHLFAAKKAVSDTELKSSLLEHPLLYAEILSHYAALTRNDEELVKRAGEMVGELANALAGSVSRGRQLSPDTINVVPLDKVLSRLDLHLESDDDHDEGEAAEERRLDPLDELVDEDWAPFPIAETVKIPPIVQMSRTLTLASNILRDSEEVSNLDLKQLVLGDVLRLWGMFADALEADPDYLEFTRDTMHRLATTYELKGDRIEEFVEQFTQVAAVLTALTGITATLSSRKLAYSLRRVLDEPTLLDDAGVVIMGALLSFDISAPGWPSTFRLAHRLHKSVRAVKDVLLPAAQYAYFYTPITEEEASNLTDFMADQWSEGSGREGTQERKNARASIVQRLERNRLQIRLKQSGLAGGEQPRSTELH